MGLERYTLLRHNRPSPSCTNLRSTDAHMALAPMLCAGLVNQPQDYGTCLRRSHCSLFEMRHYIIIFIKLISLSITLLPPMLANLANPHLPERTASLLLQSFVINHNHKMHSTWLCHREPALHMHMMRLLHMVLWHLLHSVPC